MRRCDHSAWSARLAWNDPRPSCLWNLRRTCYTWQFADPDIGHILTTPAHGSIIFLAEQTRAHSLSGTAVYVRGKMAFNVWHKLLLRLISS
jgi:hypothetical protein